MSKFLFVFLFLFLSCTQRTEFNKEKWNDKVDITYTNRDAMLHDLTTNYKLVGLSYNQLTELLGNPQNYGHADSTELYYTVVEDYGWDIDPVYMKYLVFTIDQDSVVTNFEIEEHEN